MSNIRYQVGDVRDPRPTDPKFIEYEAAEEDALLTAEQDDFVVAIWEVNEDNGHATTHRLVYQDTVWFPN